VDQYAVANLHASCDETVGHPPGRVDELGVTPDTTFALERLPDQERVRAPHVGLALQEVRDVKVCERVQGLVAELVTHVPNLLRLHMTQPDALAIEVSTLVDARVVPVGQTGVVTETDLFASAAQDRLERRQPLAARMRPTRLDDIVGQKHLLGAGKPLRSLIEADRLSSVVLWGPAGTGKTTIARVVARSTSKEFVQLSAVTATVKDVREEIAKARQRLGEREQPTILFLDEVHRFNKAQQDSLLPAVENGLITLIGATTENPYFEVNAPLLSRSTLFRLEPLDDEAILELLQRGLSFEDATADPEALEHLVARVGGDGRQSLTALEVAVALAAARQKADGGSGAPGLSIHVEPEDVEAALNVKAFRYGRDEHYDTISAFIKSIRGSDPDAAVYWLARMLEAGEDPRFIARRLVVHASEDIGMADSQALLIATAAAHAVEFVGLPEARINLAHATVYLATAPKSNRAYQSINRAQAAARTAGGEVGTHLRDAHYQGAASLGHGEGYRYPHDDPRGWVDQQYMPPEVAGERFYEPTRLGDEAVIAERLNQIHRWRHGKQ